MTEGENHVAHNLFMAGQLLGVTMRSGSPKEIKEIVKQIDPDILQGFLDSKPEGFLYHEVVEQAIRLARTFKSLTGKG